MSEDIIIKLPKLGESILNATVVQWFKKVGDVVEKDEPLLEVSTDKVNSEIPSPVSGVLKEILAKNDEELEVGGLLGVISSAGGAKEISKTEVVIKEQAATSTEMSGFYSPSVMRAAQERGISFQELSKVKGTGEGGRVTKKDVEMFVESTQKKECAFVPPREGIERVKMNPLRKAIAENMVRSFYEAPHATLITEVDVTAPLKYIAKEKESFFAKTGTKLTITGLIAQAITKALKDYPLLNSSLEQDTIVIKKHVNLGIAVSIEQGVMVPVIRHCDSLSLEEIAKAISELSIKARSQKLTHDEVKDGTITLTNFGMTGVQIGIPIIRFPEVAIVGLGAIQRKIIPLEDDSLAIRSMMHISLTFDHRVLDGIYGCDFLTSLKKHIESR